MSIGLNEEQTLIQETAMKFCSDRIEPQASQQDEKKLFPKDVLREAAELGFGAMFVPSKYGGSQMSRFDGTLVFEAMSRGCPSTTAYLSIHNMCTQMLQKFGNEEQRLKYLKDLVNLNKFSSYCLTEPNSGSDAASLMSTAVFKGDHQVLNGSKAFISAGGANDLNLVMARVIDDSNENSDFNQKYSETRQISKELKELKKLIETQNFSSNSKTGNRINFEIQNEIDCILHRLNRGPFNISCFIIEKGFKGLSFGKPEIKLGQNSQPTAALIMEDCLVPKENVLGQIGQGFKIAMAGLDGGRINIASCSLGGAQQCLDLSRDYLKSRKQFGKLLASNQALQFRVADMATELQAARLMVRNAAQMLDSKHPDSTKHCAMAKRFATDTGFKVVDQALQLHGGYGYLRDYPIERYFRDLRVHQILEGTNEIMRHIIGRSILA